MTIFFFFFLFFLLLMLQGGLARIPRDSDECRLTWCSDDGPGIRFPFWLKGHQPNHCGYPDPRFELFCSPTKNHTMLELPFSVKVRVLIIDYTTKSIYIGDPSHCYPELLPKLNLTASPFQFSQNYRSNRSIFTCSSTKGYSEYMDDTYSPSGAYFDYPMESITCRGSRSQVPRIYYAVPTDYLIHWPLLSCRKLYTVESSAYQFNYFDNYGLELSWDNFKLICGNSSNNSSSCSSSRKHVPNPPQTTGETKSLVLKGVIPSGLFLLLVVMVAIYFVHRSKKLKKEDRVKIDRFLEDYRALKPTRYAYAEIKKITDNFKDKLGQGGYGTVYKGKLSNDVHIAAKILNDIKGNGDDFINEVGTIGRIHHINVVRLVGYCADGFRRALVYEYLPNDSLDKFISSDQEKRSLGWEKLQHIALGIAKGIEYLHQGCDQRILHFDIKPHNILLDHKFNPKISDFGLAKLCSKEQSVVSMTAARGTVGYIAPEVFSRNFGNVSCKSDVYSFGMLLLEMVGGRKNTNENEQNTSEVYFPEWIYNRLNQGEEQAITIDEDGDAKIVKKLTIVGLWCIQWYPGDRPAMKVVVQMLEGDGDTLAMPPNPFTTSNSRTARVGGSFDSKLEVISESE